MTLIMNESHLANVLRPATRISQLLALQLPAVERETFCLTLIKQFPSLLSRFMERMNNQDYFLQVYSLSFINMFLASIRNIQKRSKYTYDLDDLGIRRTLMQMVQRRPDPTLQKELVSFEGLLAKEYGRRQRMAIDPSNTVHQSALEEILNALRAERGLTKGTWEDFGMAVGLLFLLVITVQSLIVLQDPFEGLQPIGVLGLECLYTMFKKDRKELSRVTHFQLKLKLCSR